MTRVIFDISMSLDGFVTASNVRPEEPMGDGGQRLHEWAFGEDERNRELLAEAVDAVGAVIAGRRTYELSVPWWGADGPAGPARVPVFVVTHSEPQDAPEGGVYTFVTDGIESALEEAKAAAGDKDVAVMGGADIGQQFIRAGLIDEISIHLVPVLLGSGTRMFEHLGSDHIQLETAGVIETPAATHLRFRVVEEQSSGGAKIRGEGEFIMANDDTNNTQANQLPQPSRDLSSLERLVGTWEMSGEVQGRVVYEWMEGGFFLMQQVDLEQYGQRIKGIEIIGHERPFGAEPSEELKSRFYSNTGDTLDYVYELEGDTLTIWGGEKGSPAYYRGTFSDDGNTLTGAWHYPGGGGYEAISTRVE